MNTGEHIQEKDDMSPKGVYNRRFFHHKSPSKETIEKIRQSNLGLKRSLETRKKISLSQKGITGEKARRWKGDNIGRSMLHIWINAVRGHPMTCEHCGKVCTKTSQIHWANKSHKYKRRLDDWLRLCVRCHHKYDKIPQKTKITKHLRYGHNL